jgi:hypothetical protein
MVEPTAQQLGNRDHSSALVASPLSARRPVGCEKSPFKALETGIALGLRAPSAARMPTTRA